MPHNPSSGSDTRLVRLNKFLSMAGFTSRRKADQMILDGAIRVNGKVVLDLGHKIDPRNDQVFAGGRQIAYVRDSVYILFNKPKDTITTLRDERGRATVVDYVHVKERIFPVGRLDRNTTGVLLLTNDGDFAQLLMHPRYELQKVYKATLDRPLLEEHGRLLSKGIRLSDGKTLPAEISFVQGGKNKVIGIAIREGRNRQIHRMFEALGYSVDKLDRIAYAGLSYDGVARGAWRYLTPREVRHLRSLSQGSDPAASKPVGKRGGSNPSRRASVRRNS